MRTLVALVALCACARARQYEPYMFAAVPLHAPLPVLRVLSPAPLGASLARPSRRPYATSVQHTAYTRPYAERPYPDRGVYAESRPFAETRPYRESRPDAERYAESRPYTETRYYGSRPVAPSPEYEESAGRTRRPVEVDPASEWSAPAPSRARRPAPAVELAVEWDAPALAEELASAEAVLYARPSPAGGYTYRPAPPRAPPKKLPAAKEQPVIVKIHKHKIIKS